MSVQVSECLPRQMREMNANSNYMSQNETISHFGLGPAAIPIRDVSVHWPASGITSRLRNVFPNRRIIVHEVTMGDFDGDLEVTIADYSGWSDCLTGPGGGPISGDCIAADFDADDDVDLIDWSGFQTSLSN